MKKRVLSIMVVAALFAPSCDSLLDTEPRQSISNEVALEDLAGANAVLIGAYNSLQATNLYGKQLIAYPELLADNMKVTFVNRNEAVTLANNAPNQQLGIWNDAYSAISRVNNILDVIDNLPGASQVEKDQIKAQCLFIRGLMYFDLVRVYARNPRFNLGNTNGVPIVLVPTKAVGPDLYPPRNSVSEVYAQIESDLIAAVTLNVNVNIPYRGSSAAASALLSRVYLYQGKWQNAIDAASTVIGSGRFNLLPTAQYANIFMNDGTTESIFEIVNRSDDNPGISGVASMYLQSRNPDNTTNGYGDFIPTDDLMSLFSATDVRGTLFVNHVKGSQPVKYTLKFPDSKGFHVTNHPVLRYAEIYLNRAEANAELNNNTAALADLNIVRARAGLAPLTGLTGEALMNAIQLERRLELAFEGHRPFDLARRGQGFTKGLTPSDCPATSPCFIPFEDYRIISPIPVAQIDVNPNMVQNPGY